jgi:competence protein ComEC
VVAALAGRPRSRWYVLLLAVAVTLAVNPRAAGDVGWQLSFAAVVGILVCCAPLAGLFAGSQPGRARRALAEAAALTISATLATAPLISLQFGVISVVSLPANLAAVAAEAPVMWLGMLAAAIGQVGWLPVEPVTWLAGLLAAYIAQVAAWFAGPDWAQVDTSAIDGVAALGASYAILGSCLALAIRWSARRRGLDARTGRGRVALAAALAVVAIGATASLPPPSAPVRPQPGLRVSVLDVGQGDAILLEPRNGDPVLVDAGPADAQVARQLRERGMEQLAAMLVTHPDADHDGGAADVLGALDVEHLLYARASDATLAAARATGAKPEPVSAGSTLRSGSLRIHLLWPPADRTNGVEPNALALVAVARWHRFRILLTGDAEAELAPIHPGDVDVIKVAHHGSEDAGLPALLAETTPELAVISVGAGNPYGHPSPVTLDALADAGIPAVRTDEAGEIQISAGGGEWRLASR